MPKITIIVSAYKERGWLDVALESAKNQTFKDYNIILSSDGNPALIKYAKKYGTKFIVTPKGNHSSALNNAVKYASGTWIKECHDDDFLTPNCLQDLWDAREGGDIIYANAINFRDGETTGRLYKPPEFISLFTFLPIIHNPCHAATIFFKRSMFLAVGGFDENLSHAEEYEFYFNILSKGYKFKYCDSTVAWYRLHGTQDTHILNTKREEIKEYIFNKARGYGCV